MVSIQALGIVRFSYAPTNGFQIAHKCVEDRLKYLFDPARIEERFALFEHVTLPAIKAQTDQDFTLVIVTSSAIPTPYLERLYHLIDGIPQIALILKEPRKHRLAMRQVMRPFKDQSCDIIAQFRLDDDDAVAVDFIERTKSAFPKLQEKFSETGKCALDFNQGYLMNFGDGKCIVRKKQIKQATAGMVIYTRPAHPKTAIDYAHFKITDFMPLVVDQTPDMFIRTLNSYNDSPNVHALPVPKITITNETHEILYKRFQISIPELLKTVRA